MHKYLYEKFEQDIIKGVEAKRTKQYPLARKHLILAADSLNIIKNETNVDSIKIKLTNEVESLLDTIDSLPEEDEIMTNCQLNSKEFDDYPNFDQVYGLDEAKEQIQARMILPFKYPEIAAKHHVRAGGGLLFYGPPGCGKTYFAKAAAKELDAKFFYLDSSEIMQKYFGESEQIIDKVFNAAHNYSKSLIFIDEIETIIPSRRSNTSKVSQRIVSQFLTELDGIKSTNRNPIFFIGATNEPWKIDRAMCRPGRFDLKVYVGLPDYDARKSILKDKLGERKLTDITIEQLAKLTDGYSGADLNELVNVVGINGMVSESNNIEMKPTTSSAFEYNKNVFDKGMQLVKPSITKSDLERLLQWQ